MQSDTWKQLGELLKTVLPVIVGVFIGAWLSRSGDRKKWLNDCRKEEYKELVTALTKASIALIGEFDPGRPAAKYMRPEELWTPHYTYTESLQILKDRIYIARELEKMNLFDRWGKSVDLLFQDKNAGKFENTFEGIRSDLILAAREPI